MQGSGHDNDATEMVRVEHVQQRVHLRRRAGPVATRAPRAHSLSVRRVRKVGVCKACAWRVWCAWCDAAAATRPPTCAASTPRPVMRYVTAGQRTAPSALFTPWSCVFHACTSAKGNLSEPFRW
eukprot:COSAG01_NODE_2760_length_7120_cov_49.854253_10_plen_124_part_00